MFLKSGLGWIRIQKKQSRNTWNTGNMRCLNPAFFGCSPRAEVFGSAPTSPF